MCKNYNYYNTGKNNMLIIFLEIPKGYLKQKVQKNIWQNAKKNKMIIKSFQDPVQGGGGHFNLHGQIMVLTDPRV